MSRFVPKRAAGGILLLAAFLSALGLWAPTQFGPLVVSSQPARQAPAPQPSPAYLFLSPNTDEGISAEEALRRARSPDQAHFKRLAEDILRSVGVVRPCVLNAVGDWSDGTENSLLAVIPDPPDQATLGYAAGWFGLLAQQKAVLVFRPGAGADAVALLDVPRCDLGKVRQLLDAHGLPFRTLLPRGDGQRVVVFDKGRRLQAALDSLVSQLGVRCWVARGQGEVLGGRTRGKAHERYKAVIEAYEEKHHRRRFRPGHLAPVARLAPAR